MNSNPALGLDVQYARHAARQMEEGAVVMQQIVRQATASIADMIWEGQDKRAFVDDWNGTFIPLLQSAVRDLLFEGEDLRRSADLQEQASSAAGLGGSALITEGTPPAPEVSTVPTSLDGAAAGAIPTSDQSAGASATSGLTGGGGSGGGAAHSSGGGGGSGGGATHSSGGEAHSSGDGSPAHGVESAHSAAVATPNDRVLASSDGVVIPGLTHTDSAPSILDLPASGADNPLGLSGAALAAGAGVGLLGMAGWRRIDANRRRAAAEDADTLDAPIAHQHFEMARPRAIDQPPPPPKIPTAVGNPRAKAADLSSGWQAGLALGFGAAGRRIPSAPDTFATSQSLGAQAADCLGTVWPAAGMKERQGENQ